METQTDVAAYPRMFNACRHEGNGVSNKCDRDQDEEDDEDGDM